MTVPGNPGGEQPVPGGGPGPGHDPVSDEIRRKHEEMRTQEEADKARKETINITQNAPRDEIPAGRSQAERAKQDQRQHEGPVEKRPETEAAERAKGG